MTRLFQSRVDCADFISGTGAEDVPQIMPGIAGKYWVERILPAVGAVNIAAARRSSGSTAVFQGSQRLMATFGLCSRCP